MFFWFVSWLLVAGLGMVLQHVWVSGWVIVGDCFDFVGFMLVCWWLLMLVGGSI